MKNIFSRMFRSVVEWFRPSRRIQTEQTISPEQFQKMLAQTLADPEFKLLLLKSMAGTVFPVQGGMACGGGTLTGPGGCTANKLLKWSTTNGCDPVDSTVFDNGTNSGVGTTTPQERWHVHVASGYARELVETADASGAGAMTFYQTGLSKWSQGARDDWGTRKYVITDEVALAARLTLDSGGNVGIGTTSPGDLLHVSGGRIRSEASGDVRNLVLNQTGSSLRTQISFSQGGTEQYLLGVDLSSASVRDFAIFDSVSGYSRLLLNEGIIYLKPNGSTDGTQINNAISALPSDGGIIYLTPGTYHINTKINISNNGVKIRAYGAGVTILLWTGGSSSDAVINVGVGTAIHDVEISDLEIDGNSGNAGVGLVIDGVTDSKFRRLTIHHFNNSSGIGLKLFVTTGNTLSWNVFEGIDIHDGYTGVLLDSTHRTLGSTGVVNPAHNTFINLNVQHITQYGIELGDCDNNSFQTVLTPGAEDGYEGALAGVVAHLDVPSGSSQTWARSNYFYHLQAGGRTALVGVSVNPSLTYTGPKNLVFGYDYANGEDQPRIYSSSTPDIPPDYTHELSNVTDYFFWIDSSGSVN